jgi:hypothetical protein
LRSAGVQVAASGPRLGPSTPRALLAANQEPTVNRFQRILAACVVAATLASAAVPAVHAEWPVEGIRLAGPARLQALLPDGSGGALVLWTAGASDFDWFAQRVDATGALAPGWPADGRPVPGLERMTLKSLAADGQGGAYVLGERDTLLTAATGEIRMELLLWRIDSQGNVAAGWALRGLLLDSMTFDENSPATASWVGGGGHRDSADGAFLEYGWGSSYPPVGNTRGNSILHALHVGADHVVRDWQIENFDLRYCYNWGGSVGDGAGGHAAVLASFETAGGITVRRQSASGFEASRVLVESLQLCDDEVFTGILPISPGPDLLVTTRFKNLQDPQGLLHLWRLDPSLQLAPGWPENGVLAPYVPFAADGGGGVFCVVDDGTGVPRLQRFLLNTTRPIARWLSPVLPEWRSSLWTIDGTGGMFQAWLDGGSGHALRAEHIPSDGAVDYWGEGGVQLSAAATSPMLTIGAGDGHALVAWTDAGADAGAVYLQMIADDASVPAAASLVSVGVTAERVRLEWSVPGAAGPFAVERRAEDHPWGRAGETQSTGFERWSFEDRDVRPGERLGYRLSTTDGILPGSETSVLVPAPVAFALLGFPGNPAADAATVEFSLPDARPARLEVFDLSGRLLARRDVGSLGAGTHSVELPELHALPPGLVFVRLARGGESLTARGTRLR